MTQPRSSDGEPEDLMLRMAARRAANMPVRLAAAAAIMLLSNNLIDGRVTLVWFCIYVGAQVAEQPLLRLMAAWRADAQVKQRLLLGLLGLNVVMFCLPALPMLTSPGWLGRTTAILLLAGTTMNASVIGRGAKAIFLVCVTPAAVLLLASPAVMAYAAHTFDLVHAPWILLVGAVVVVANVIAIYLAGERALAAEAQARRELEEKRRQAEAATEAKSAFVAAVSHDLRTPLTAILASAAAIRRDTRDPDLTDRAAMIGEAVEMMRTLLNDLLDMAKIESGRMSVETTAFDPRALVEEVRRFWSEEAARKGLGLEVQGLDALARRAGGDPVRIHQILNNLLSNAVKFTASGGVVIDASTRPERDGGLGLRIAVADTGPGLSDAQMARLFTRFDQTDGTVARRHGGTGLGLAISRELARLMQGDITVDSGPGRGACFILSCRLAQAPEDESGADGLQAVEGGADASYGRADRLATAEAAEALRCLVVDDHELNRRALTLLLEPLGVRPALARDGEEALALLARQAFDVVLMDLNMDGLDGRETTRRLRASPGPNRAVPVIAVTGAVEPETLQGCLTAGMDAWVAKPLEPCALYAAIERVLGAATDDLASAA